jgi:hypothetical protein
MTSCLTPEPKMFLVESVGAKRLDNVSRCGPFF